MSDFAVSEATRLVWHSLLSQCSTRGHTCLVPSCNWHPVHLYCAQAKRSGKASSAGQTKLSRLSR